MNVLQADLPKEFQMKLFKCILIKYFLLKKYFGNLYQFFSIIEDKMSFIRYEW